MAPIFLHKGYGYAYTKNKELNEKTIVWHGPHNKHSRLRGRQRGEQH